MLQRTETPLCVPTWEEREALTEGARYTAEKGFFAPSTSDLSNFWKWLPRMYDPEAPRPILVPEMLPVTTWEKNVRHLLGSPTWDRMRRHAYRAAGFRCEICGSRGPLEAHESWLLENETCTQKLVKILCLCPQCHKSHHLGIAKRLGIYGEVKSQLVRVNGWTTTELELAVREAYAVWEQRCDWPWVVDLSWLQDSGYVYV